jgi:UDP:flavonoid glycosyltransferase YjiC (YdhE family)
MVVIPGIAGDQPFVAAAVKEWGAGLALPGNAGAEAIRAAAQEVLSTPSFRENTRHRRAALAGVDGAARAANEVEALLSSKCSPSRIAKPGHGREPSVMLG